MTDLLHRLTSAYTDAADPVRAAGAAAYMRNQFPFLGVATPRRRLLDRQLRTGLPAPDEAEVRRVAEACWALPEREYQYFACDWLIRYGRRCGPALLDTVRTLVTTKSWWDTVDPLATGVVGDLVTRHPELARTMDAWSADEDMWLVRTAILHQLNYGAATDVGRLFGYCDRQAGHPDFFVRKAIGWALRQYARTDAQAVWSYLDSRGDRLSPLTRREAAKHR